jgi:hypothetical protein
MRFNWRRVLAKEYNTLFAVLGLILFVQAATRLEEGEMTEARWMLTIGAGLLLLGGYLGVRLMKKRGRLRSP